MLVHPATVLGLGDGGAHCGAICDASNPDVHAHALGARPQPRRRACRSRLVVHKMTREQRRRSTASTTAASSRPGKRADLNVIDLDGCRSHSPEFVHDLPGGAGRLVQGADGYGATIVAAR